MLSCLPLSRACFFVTVSGTVTPLHASITATAFSFSTYAVLESGRSCHWRGLHVEGRVTAMAMPGHWPFPFLACGKWILKYHTHPVSPDLKTFLCRHGKRYTFTPHTYTLPAYPVLQKRGSWARPTYRAGPLPAHNGTADPHNHTVPGAELAFARENEFVLVTVFPASIFTEDKRMSGKWATRSPYFCANMLHKLFIKGGHVSSRRKIIAGESRQ